MLEALVVALLAKPFGLAAGRAIVASLTMNLATQPALYLALVGIDAPAGAAWWTVFALAEAVVVAVEAGLYLALVVRGRRHAALQALALSTAANAASSLVGLTLPI